MAIILKLFHESNPRTTELWIEEEKCYITDVVKTKKMLFGFIPVAMKSRKLEITLPLKSVTEAMQGTFVRFTREAISNVKTTNYLKRKIKKKHEEGKIVTEISVDKKTNSLIVADRFETDSSKKKPTELILNVEDVEYAIRYGYVFHGYDRLRRREVLWF